MHIFTNCIALALAFAPGARDDNPKNVADLKSLQGTWTAVSAVDPNGEPAPKEFVDSFKIVVKDDSLVMEAGKPPEGTEVIKHPRFQIKIDASASPKTIDFLGVENVPSKDAMLGTYALDGDELKLCFPFQPGDARPKAVEASKEAKTGLFTLKRAK